MGLNAPAPSTACFLCNLHSLPPPTLLPLWRLSLALSHSQAYGSKGVGEIPGNATLTIDVELLSIKQSVFGSRVKLVEG